MTAKPAASLTGSLSIFEPSASGAGTHKTTALTTAWAAELLHPFRYLTYLFLDSVSLATLPLTTTLPREASYFDTSYSTGKGGSQHACVVLLCEAGIAQLLTESQHQIQYTQSPQCLRPDEGL